MPPGASAAGWRQTYRVRFIASPNACAARSSTASGGSLVRPLRKRHVLEHERFLVQHGRPIGTVVRPRRDVGEVLVVALGFAVRRFVLRAEVRAARLLALERVAAHELRQLEKVGHATGMLERLIELGAGARHTNIVPELVAKLGNEIEGLVQSRRVARHPAVLPHDLAELAMDRGDGATAVHGKIMWEYCGMARDATG